MNFVNKTSKLLPFETIFYKQLKKMYEKQLSTFVCDVNDFKGNISGITVEEKSKLKFISTFVKLPKIYKCIYV